MESNAQTNLEEDSPDDGVVMRGLCAFFVCTLLLLVLGGGGYLAFDAITSDTPPEVFGWWGAFWVIGGICAVFGIPVSIAIAIYFAWHRHIRLWGLAKAAIIGGGCILLIWAYLYFIGNIGFFWKSIGLFQ